MPTQDQFCQQLMSDGTALQWFEDTLAQKTQKSDHLTSFTRMTFLQNMETLHRNFAYDTGAGLVLWHSYISTHEETVNYQKKEVGALIRFGETALGNEEGVISLSYLRKLPTVMTLNNAQLGELEFLLNKAGESLGTPVPAPEGASEQEQREVLGQLALEALQEKPKRSYQRFLDRLKAAGKPIVMTQPEFEEFMTRTLMEN